MLFLCQQLSPSPQPKHGVVVRVSLSPFLSPQTIFFIVSWIFESHFVIDILYCRNVAPMVVSACECFRSFIPVPPGFLLSRTPPRAQNTLCLRNLVATHDLHAIRNGPWLAYHCYGLCRYLFEQQQQGKQAKGMCDSPPSSLPVLCPRAGRRDQ